MSYLVSLSVIKTEINFLLCRYGHMIDNVVLIVTGTLHERDVQELLEKCHPLGMFDRYPDFCALYNILMLAHRILILLFFFSGGILLSIATLAVAQNMRELYRLVLVDTPLAPYFSECITSEVNHLSRKYLFPSILFNINQFVVLIVVVLLFNCKIWNLYIYLPHVYIWLVYFFDVSAHGSCLFLGLGWHEHWNNEEHSLQGIPWRLLQILSGEASLWFPSLFFVSYLFVFPCDFLLTFINFNVICKQKLGGATAEIMSDLLAFEADRRAVNITINR